MPVENGGGDVGGEVGEPEKPAEVGAVEPLALCQIAELAAFVLDQHVVETVGSNNQADQRPVGFRGRRERIGMVDHRPDFLAGAAQMQRMWAAIDPLAELTRRFNAPSSQIRL